MQFFADFHIHSKYSRATAKNLDLENLYILAQIKGITVLGTGDFTHPAWWRQIEEKLEPAQEGLWRLKPSIARECDRKVPASCRRAVRFMLVTEISNIYKKNGRTRKNHNLVFMPHAEAAEHFIRRLEVIGNIQSDGRPILGLDARSLLEIVLETSATAYMVPAHIWTPWFSLLGSKSGFDTVEECFEDLTPHIFALETGLSSDPPMNWRVANLDRYTLISNSDAHSPAKLGREANRFDCDLSFSAIRDAMKEGDPRRFLGTVEFYSQEGKYHIDGHRKCGFSCLPDETRRLKNSCPRCGKPLTLGVLYRVETLADRKQGFRPPKAAAYQNLIPLDELLSEVLRVGTKTKKVARAYDRLIGQYGAEFDILRDLPLEILERDKIPLLGEAIRRMREGEVVFNPGFDGEFGKVKIFNAHDFQRLKGQQKLFDSPETPNKPQKDGPTTTTPRQSAQRPKVPDLFEAPQTSGFVLNERQQEVVDYGAGPLLISAGPGTGKTRAITCRMAALMERGNLPADKILALTFTNKAAQEMRHRLQRTRVPGAATPLVTTFHGLCRRLLKETRDNQDIGIVDDEARRAILTDAMEIAAAQGSKSDFSVKTMIDMLVAAKQQLLRPSHDLSAVVPRARRKAFTRVYACYQQLLVLQEVLDFEDLILESVDQLERDKSWRKTIRKRYSHVFVDEFQDINYGQYRLLRALAPPSANICAIGDPDQAIYGFRGSDRRYFQTFTKDYPACGRIHLTRNYRSTKTILNAAFQVINQGRPTPQQKDEPQRTYSHISGITAVEVIEAASERAEAVAIGQTIEQMVGGTGFHSLDFDKLGKYAHGPDHSFADFAVLCRTGRQVEQIARQLTSAAIPCQWVSCNILDRPAVKSLLAALRVITGQGSYADLGRIKRLISAGISNKSMRIFRQWAYARSLPLAKALRDVSRLPIAGMSRRRQQRLAALALLLEKLRRESAGLDVAATLAHIVAHTTLSASIESGELKRLSDLARSLGCDKAAFGATLALRRDTDFFQEGVEKVAVMTLHAAKGLEFPVVFVAGCEERLLPYRRPGGNVDLEEERRLFYVGMTRARAQLFLTWARRRAQNGVPCDSQISRFVTAIESRLKTYTSFRRKPRKPNQRQLTLF